MPGWPGSDSGSSDGRGDFEASEGGAAVAEMAAELAQMLHGYHHIVDAEGARALAAATMQQGLAGPSGSLASQVHNAPCL